MQFVTIRDFRSNTAAIRKALERGRDIVLTANGRPFAILSAVNPDNVEEELLAIRRARARMALDHIRAKAKAEGVDGMSSAEIDGVVAKARSESRSRARGRR